MGICHEKGDFFALHPSSPLLTRNVAQWGGNMLGSQRETTSNICYHQETSYKKQLYHHSVENSHSESSNWNSNNWGEFQTLWCTKTAIENIFGFFFSPLDNYFSAIWLLTALFWHFERHNFCNFPGSSTEMQWDCIVGHNFSSYYFLISFKKCYCLCVWRGESVGKQLFGGSF